MSYRSGDGHKEAWVFLKLCEVRYSKEIIMTKVLVVATSRKTRGGITSVVKAHETGEQWKKYHCKWIETHRDGPAWRKIWYLVTALVEYVVLLPFYDIVHIHVGVYNSVTRKLIFATLARMFSRKVIVHFHPASEQHLTNPEWMESYKQLFDKSDALIVLAPHWKHMIEKLYSDRNYNIIHLYNPCPTVERNSLSKENVILFAGTLIDRKGYHRLLRAFAMICEKYKEWRIEFAGNGEIDKAKVLQKEFGIPEKQVDYLGWVSGRNKDEVFLRASIYCLPSRGEGFPMGVLDALAYGIPVITTPVGGIVDVMKHKRDGLIFDVYNIEELAGCLEYMMSSAEERERFVKNADILVKGELNICNICKRLDVIYADVIAGNRLGK